MASPLQNRNAQSQPPAGQSMYIPERTMPPVTYAMIPGQVVPIPQHIRPFLDTTHEPTEHGFVPNPRPDARDDVPAAYDYYYKLCRLPPVRHPATNRILSAYSGVELEPNLRFSGHQFDEYIFHAVRQGRKFMFRVEKQHTLMGYRYPRGHESTRCRFAKCPLDGTIRSGQIRVCISEFADPRNEILDPYHNAGYAHVYCLEKFCNLHSLLVETNITFLPAVELAKELSFPAALNAAEHEACLQWAREARQSWRGFKSTYPIPEVRPRYKPSAQGRLHYRLDQIREAQKVSTKQRHRDHDGPQVYTYDQRRRNPTPEAALKRPWALPPGISTPTYIQRNGPQVFQAAPILPYQRQPPTSHPRTYNNHNLPVLASLPTSPGQTLTGLAKETPTQLSANGDGGLGPGAEYYPEEIGALLAQEFADYLESALEEFPWHDPAAPHAAGSQEAARPEQSTQPEHTPEPEQSDQQVATVEIPVVITGGRKSRRSSAPPILGIRNVRVRKSLKASRRSSRQKMFR